MAGADYCCCEICGIRLFYDGDCIIRNQLKDRETEFNFLVCSKCYEKKLNRIVKLEKKLKGLSEGWKYPWEK